MKKILLLLFIYVTLLPLAFPQNMQVKWGSDVDGFERLLRVDDDGFYCFFSEPGKKKTIAPFLVKYDNNLNRVFSNEIVAAGEKVFLNNFFALKENFAFVTSMNSDYYISLINPQGQSTEAKHIYTNNATNYSSEGIEGSVITFPSEDSSHIVLYFNPGLAPGNYNFKAQKANEFLDFIVINNNLETVYSRNVTLNHPDIFYRTFDFLLSKDNKLVTYSMINKESTSFSIPFSHDKKRGEIIPKIAFAINIYGQTPDQDKELFLPQNTYKFYSEFRLKTQADGKIYLTSLCTNDPYGNPQGIMVCEINTKTNSITPKYYPFAPEMVQLINKSNGDSFKKKEPGIYTHSFLNVHQKSNGNFYVILERLNGYIRQQISIMELEKSGSTKLTILAKSQNWKNDRYQNSVSDYFANDKLSFVYNDHSNNLKAEKITKYSSNSSHFNIVAVTLNGNGLDKSPISDMGNDGFHFDTISTNSNSNKLVLVSRKNDMYRLGLMSPKAIK